ncbi:PLP-dependent aminotransferase family protein [Methylocystis sp. Sn-Cys]|uniref:aminotransferase-like domain-containing protein n=1 Tax=Methylocystis sp. Sn-Cys TaxID=1701263 RepID=UPI0019240367|nr:PLP-dependent aminotransferase family protein [Methylocystis sp. Sn-Cys]MBL1257818.1 PLP-dependent aminotransferase family protein [Methylocystis sp. Sn-Cys]
MTGKQQYWLPEIENAGKPVYLEIADAIERDVESGRLAVSARLPPQRYVADKLGVNLATVARAYTEAQQRGLIDSRVGQGTFVRRPAERRTAAPPRSPMRGDMLMNMPPEPYAPALLERMQAGIEGLDDLPSLLRYQEFGGSPEARAAGARWLSPRLGDLALDRLLVFPGAQASLLCVLSGFTQPGDVVCCEELTYPGFKSLAQQFGLRLVGLPLDDEGIDASAFAKACNDAAVKLLYMNPTLLNPTTTTTSKRRREALIKVARAQGVMILEDDAYGALPLESPPSFARLAPDITFHVSSLAKCVGAGLRVAYMSVPEGRHAARLMSALSMTNVFASPITTAIATRWIEEGVASAALEGIRSETRARQELVARTLPVGSYVSDPEAFHLWLRLPQGWNRHAFESHLRGLGVSVAVSDAFAVTSAPPEAVRLCLGGPASRSDVQTSLAILADSLAPRPLMASMVI